MEGGRKKGLDNGQSTLLCWACLEPSLLGVKFAFKSLVPGLKGLGTHQVTPIVVTTNQ